MTPTDKTPNKPMRKRTINNTKQSPNCYDLVELMKGALPSAPAPQREYFANRAIRVYRQNLVEESEYQKSLNDVRFEEYCQKVSSDIDMLFNMFNVGIEDSREIVGSEGDNAGVNTHNFCEHSEIAEGVSNAVAYTDMNDNINTKLGTRGENINELKDNADISVEINSHNKSNRNQELYKNQETCENDEIIAKLLADNTENESKFTKDIPQTNLSKEIILDYYCECQADLESTVEHLMEYLNTFHKNHHVEPKFSEEDFPPFGSVG